MHRIQWFDQQIRENRYPNSTGLAKQFEISKRQAQRDIEYLEMSLRAPLLYIAKHRGYCYENHTYILPHLYMTEDEMKVLKYLAHRYRHYNYDNAAAVKRVAHLLDRITETQETELFSSLPVFESNPRILQTLELLSHAIQESLVVHIIYKEQTEEKSLSIYPIKVVSRFNADYVVAYCEQQSRQKSFRLDGIRQAVATTRKFQLSPDIEVREREEQPAVRKPFVAKMRLTAPLHASAWNGFYARSKEGLVYDIEFYDIDYFLQQLMAAEWEELLSPQWLKVKLHSRCQQVLVRLKIIGTEN